MEHEYRYGLCVKCGETDRNASEFDFLRAWYDVVGTEPRVPSQIDELMADRKLPDIRLSREIRHNNTKWFLKSLVDSRVVTGDIYERVVEFRGADGVYRVVEIEELRLSRTDSSGHSVAQRLLGWFCTGEIGMSASAIARAAAGTELGDGDERVPLDISDFRRCALLLRRVPEAREFGVRRLAHKFPRWAALEEVWDEIDWTLVRELGGDSLPKGKSAPRAHAILKAALKSFDDELERKGTCYED